MIVVCDGSVSGAAARAAVKRMPDAASRSTVGVMPAPTRSARNVSIVIRSTFGAGRLAGGADRVQPVMQNAKCKMQIAFTARDDITRF